MEKSLTPAPGLPAHQEAAVAAWAAVLARPWGERGHNAAPVPQGAFSQDEAEKGLVDSGLIPLYESQLDCKQGRYLKERVGPFHPTLREVDGVVRRPVFVDDEGNLIVEIAPGDRANAPAVFARIGQMADPGPILPEEAIQGLLPVVVHSDDGYSGADHWPVWGDQTERAAARAAVIAAIQAL